MWSAVTWCLTLAIVALGASAARSAWRAPELASRGRLGAHFRWHRRGYAAAIVGILLAFASASVGVFADVAGVDPSQKRALLQGGIDTTISRPAFMAASFAAGLSAISVFWLGWRHGYVSRDRPRT